MVFSRKLIRFLLAEIIISFILVIYLNTPALSKTFSIQELNTLIGKIQKDAEKQIRDIHGQQMMSLIKDRLQKQYHLNSLPFPKPGDPCPAMGYGKKDIGTIIETKALSKSGVYYIFSVKAVLQNHLFIAKWGFAKASFLDMECPANMNNLGFILNACKEYKHAIAILNYAKKHDPADSSIYANLAYSYQKLHRYNEAISEMMIAVSFQPRLKRYKEKLDELKKLKKEKKYQIIGKPEENTVSGLENALDLLEEKKQEENNTDTQFVFNPSFPSNNGSSQVDRNWRNDVTDMIHSYDTTVFDDGGDAACSYFKKQAHLLVRMGDGVVEKAGAKISGNNPIDKFISTGFAHIRKREEVTAKIDSKSYSNQLDLIKDFATIGALETANIFYGIAGEMYEMCGEIEADPGIDQFLDDLIKERIKWTKDFFKNIDKEKFSRPVCTFNMICISKGNQGSTKISVTESLIGVDIIVHPTNIYKYQLKVSVGGDLLKKAFGNIASAGLSHSHYFEYKFGRGMSRGTELKVGGVIGKGISTKGDVVLTKYSFEN
jgi:hypothetical protein